MQTLNSSKILLRKCSVLFKVIKIVLLLDKATTHPAKLSQEKIGFECSTPIHQTLYQVIFIFFHSLENEKNVSLDYVKMFVENLSNSKLAKFYLRGINKLFDKWQELIHDIDEYIIDWN